MHLYTVLATVAVAAPFVSAHNGLATPKILGVNIRDLKARNILTSMADRANLHEARIDLESRQNTNGQCGPGFGSCAAGSCCNQDGCKLRPQIYSGCHVDVNSVWPGPRVLLFPRLSIRLWSSVPRKLAASGNQLVKCASYKSWNDPIWRRGYLRMYLSWRHCYYI